MLKNTGYCVQRKDGYMILSWFRPSLADVRKEVKRQGWGSKELKEDAFKIVKVKLVRISK